MKQSIFVTEPALARRLREKRLLTSSLKHEPTFKHEDPDEAPDLATKKGRKVASFLFESLLPLSLTEEEARLCLELGLIDLVRVNPKILQAVEPPSDRVESTPALHGVDRLESISQSPKFVVFKDLWFKGFCMVDGLKFGVDYLCYGSDPTKTHADLMVTVMQGPSTDPGMSAIDTVALSAVAAKARKTFVLATIESDSVTYTKMQRIPVVPKQQPKPRSSQKTRIRLFGPAGSNDDDVMDELPDS